MQPHSECGCTGKRAPFQISWIHPRISNHNLVFSYSKTNLLHLLLAVICLLLFFKVALVNNSESNNNDDKVMIMITITIIIIIIIHKI